MAVQPTERSAMKKILFVVSMLGLAVGCGGNVGDEAIAKMESAKKQICACKDKACAEKVGEDMRKWMDSKEKDNKDFKPSKAQMEKIMKVTSEIEACMDKLKEADKPAGDAPAPAGDAPAPQ